MQGWKCKSENKVRSKLSQKDKVTVQVPVVAAVPAVLVSKASIRLSLRF